MSGIYYGSKFVAVYNSNNLDDCYVEQVDIRPDADGVLKPILRGGVITKDVFDTIDEAKKAVRKFLIRKASNYVYQSAAAAEIHDADAARYKHYIDTNGMSKTECRQEFKRLKQMAEQERLRMKAFKRQYSRLISVK